MPDRYPLSSSRMADLSEQLRNQAEAYAKARLARGVDDDNFDVAAASEALAKTQNSGAVELNWRKDTVGDVPVFRSAHQPGPMVLYIHGGGFVGGNWASHAHICDHLCRVVGAEGIFVEYRLAPEHPFPAAFLDVEAVFRAMPEDRPILLAGDSVGGALSMYLARLDRENDSQRIRAVALMAPMLDFNATTSHYMRNYGRARSMIAKALSQEQVSDPRLDIIDRVGEGLPPTLIQTGGADYVQDDGHRLCRAMLDANCTVVVEHWPHMPHVWHRYTPDAPEAYNAVARAGHFLRDYIGQHA
ncbi:alpha/beta hydrolase [Hoeflea sp.]|uniref:alpha/beta hydrolase n=1 Tax=Hoeflea sp. TaxID=1940281 RepID=UPI003B01AF36